MCNCIKNLEKKMIGREYNHKKVVKAELVTASLIFSNEMDTHSIQTHSEIECQLEGQKKGIKYGE